MADAIVFNHIPQVIRNLQRARGQLVRAGAFKVQRYAQEECPVDTGFLKNSHYTVAGESRALVVVGADYGVYVHMGTIHQAANPWLLRAAYRAAPEYTAAWIKLLQSQAHLLQGQSVQAGQNAFLNALHSATHRSLEHQKHRLQSQLGLGPHHLNLGTHHHLRFKL